MDAGAPRVSVVVPTRNAGPGFERTLEAIAGQRLGEPFEVVVIDSGSSDGTPDRCRTSGARVISIPPGEFGHGRTRNRAISQCGGEYVALIVQDAVPANQHWLSSLVAALDDNQHAAGAYSRHLPHENAGFIARHVAGYWHRHQRGRVEQRIADMAAFEQLSYEARQWQCTFNNVSSIVRRAVWERHPFRDVPFAEDLAWGYDVLRAGHTLIYEPRSVVRHSHERSNWYELRRAHVHARIVGELFAEEAQPLSLGGLARLWRLWREARARTEPSRARREVECILAEDEEALDGRQWYRRHFTLPALARVVGLASPYPEAERQDLVFALNRAFQRARARQPRGQARRVAHRATQEGHCLPDQSGVARWRP